MACLVASLSVFVFFFKQKTAYEMRISDWSSDVCSSDLNYSIGITLTPSNGFTMTVDAYRIKISDQIYATTLIDVTPEIEAAMTAAGIEGAGSIDQLNYFQNAFDSTVQGVDVVASYRANLIEEIGRAHV